MTKHELGGTTPQQFTENLRQNGGVVIVKRHEPDRESLVDLLEGRPVLPIGSPRVEQRAAVTRAVEGERLAMEFNTTALFIARILEEGALTNIDEELYRPAGVDPVSKRKSLDQFAHPRSPLDDAAIEAIMLELRDSGEIAARTAESREEQKKWVYIQPVKGEANGKLVKINPHTDKWFPDNPILTPLGLRNPSPSSVTSFGRSTSSRR